MNLSIYTQENFEYNDMEFVIKAFHDNENFGYIVRVFFGDGTKANNFSYSVNYDTKQALIDATGDNAVSLLIEHAKEDVKAGIYFNKIFY